MAGSVCDVCGGQSVGVASSALGAVSFAYCERCLKENAEPYYMLASTIAMCGGRDKIADWMQPVIEGTLKVAGRTLEDLDRDIEREIKMFEQWYDYKG